MKKILTVALSTAMAFSMFASVAFGDTAVTPQQKFDALAAKGIFNGYPDQQAHLEKEMTRAEFAKVITKLLGLKEVTGTLSYKDKGYDAKNWAVPYIEAVTAAGIMQGQDNVKKIFNYNGKVTIQEMATVLTRALKLEIPANPNNNAADWAKGYVQAAIDKGLISKDANFKANASRSQLVEAAYAIDQAANITFTYKVVDPSNVEFTLSTGEVVKVKLDKPLEANKETEVKFKDAAGNEYTGKVTWVVTSATKVVSAASSNLKEVEVSFDGKVDKATATDKDNYSIDKGAKGIKSIALLEDGKTARILLNDTSKFVQGTAYKVVVKNVKGENGTVLPQSEQSFTSSDNTLPTVTEVKALGNKAVKVTFSEPVVAPSSTNFQLDDKAFVGNVTLGNNAREVVLKDYSGNLALGAHKLTTSLVEDYAGLKSLASTSDFTVAEDKEGPTVTGVTATLEKVTVTFNEEIDPDSIKDESFYWLNGTSKKTGKATLVSGNVVEVDFSGNRLPGYETTLYVDVKDYSGNANAVKEQKITASVDLVQPHVVETYFGTNKANELTVRFDKAVDAGNKKYYTVKNSDGDVIPVESAYAIDGTNKTFNVRFYNTLKYGTYSLKVAGVQDKTALQNTLVEYNGTFTATDKNAPTILGDIDANNSTRKVTLNFGRTMDLSTLQNPKNYYINFNGQNISLPADVQIRTVNGGQSVVLQFPEYIDGTRVSFKDAITGAQGTVSSVTVVGLQSTEGQNVLFDSKPVAVQQLATKGVEQKDARTFKLTFNQVIASASTGDFTVGGYYPTSVSIDNNVVTLKTDRDIPAGADVKVVAGNRIETYSGNVIGTATENPSNKLAPKVAWNKDSLLPQSDRTVVIPFDTNLAEKYNNQDLEKSIKNDLVIKQLGAEKTPTLDKTDYETSFGTKADGSKDTSKVVVKFLVNYDADYSIQVKNANYIRNAEDATVTAADSDEYTTSKNVWSDSTTVTGAAKYTATDDAAQAKADFGDLTITAKQPGTAGDAIKVTVALDATGNQSVPVVVSGTTITLKDDTVNVNAVVNAVNGYADLSYTASVKTGDGTTIPVPASKNLTGGKNPSGGSVKVTLNKEVATIAKQVTVGEKTYDAVLNPDNKKEITFDVKADSVVGQKYSINVSTDNGREQTVTGEIK